MEKQRIVPTFIKTTLRVNALKIQPFAYNDGESKTCDGETLEMRASGFWEDGENNKYPASLHVIVYPGHGVVPAIGDNITVSIERA